MECGPVASGSCLACAEASAVLMPAHMRRCGAMMAVAGTWCTTAGTLPLDERRNRRR